MIRKFVGREKELKFLEKEFAKKTSNFIVIYGRRRIGKTEQIKKSPNTPYNTKKKK